MKIRQLSGPAFVIGPTVMSGLIYINTETETFSLLTDFFIVLNKVYYLHLWHKKHGLNFYALHSLRFVTILFLKKKKKTKKQKKTTKL